MKRRLLLVFVMAVLAVLALAPVLAQDATQEASTAGTGGTINCDADLMLNLYIANRFFGYGAVQSQLMQGGVAGAVDTSAYNMGQFGTLNNTVQSMSDQTTGMMTNSGWSPDQITGISGMMSMDQATFDQQWNTAFGGDPKMATMTPLTSSTMAGEAAECSALRTSLYRFWQAVALQDFTTGMTGLFSSGSNMGTGSSTSGDMGAATPEATPGM
jgi:hypothetical protein